MSGKSIDSRVTILQETVEKLKGSSSGNREELYIRIMEYLLTLFMQVNEEREKQREEEHDGEKVFRKAKSIHSLLRQCSIFLKGNALSEDISFLKIAIGAIQGESGYSDVEVAQLLGLDVRAQPFFKRRGI